jgi:hypothetical protein
MMASTDVTRNERESLFDVSFWLACENEAAEILRALTGADDEDAGHGHSTLGQDPPTSSSAAHPDNSARP